MAAEEEGRWHRVCLNTIVRKGMALDSERLRILPMGSKVWVVEQVERRVRIDRPIKGWCSLKSSNGDTILTPLEQTTEESSTPASTRSLEQRAADAKAKFDNATRDLASKATALSSNTNMNQENKTDMMGMIANQEIEGLRKQVEDLKLRTSQQDAKHQSSLEEFEEAVTAANEAKIRAEALKKAAENKMRELNLLKEQFVSMFTQMEGESTSDEPRPIEDGGVLFLQTGDVVLCRFKGQIPESGEDTEWLGVLFNEPYGNTDGRFTTDGVTFGDTYYLENCQMNYGAFVRPTEVRRRLFADELLHQLSKAMSVFVQNQSVVEGANGAAVQTN